MTLYIAWVVTGKELYLVHEFIKEDSTMNNGCFGPFGMDQPFYRFTPYFHTPSGYQLTRIYPRHQILPTFTPDIPQSDVIPVPKPSKSFTVEDILRRPHPGTTCTAARTYLPGLSEVTDGLDYSRFGQIPYHWERGMWHAAISQRFAGKVNYGNACLTRVTPSSIQIIPHRKRRIKYYDTLNSRQ